jgi:hypothetical protein
VGDELVSIGLPRCFEVIYSKADPV